MQRSWGRNELGSLRNSKKASVARRGRKEKDNTSSQAGVVMASSKCSINNAGEGTLRAPSAGEGMRQC